MDVTKIDFSDVISCEYIRLRIKSATSKNSKGVHFKWPFCDIFK